MKLFKFILLLSLPFLMNSQTVADFENFNLQTDSVLNNAGATGGFYENGIFLNNSYFLSSGYEVWSGFSISAATDVTTPGYLNQYSAITGAGYDNSSAYAVAYAFDPIWMRIENVAFGATPVGMYITNGTYPFLNMRDGDAYSKKFGGPTGDDPDFFKLTVRAKWNGDFTQDSVEFYLADYRFSDNSQDYIIEDWTWLDLSGFGQVDSIMFHLSSSDNNAFGMVTPGYFCADNITTLDYVSTKKVLAEDELFSFSPNPSRNFISLNKVSESDATLQIIANNGQTMLQRTLSQSLNRIDIGFLSDGIYTIVMKNEDDISSQVLVKQ